jgi:mxaJ protein
MSLSCHSGAVLRRQLIAAVAALAAGHAVGAPLPTAAEAGSIDVLSVCADPANLPYSNDRQEGFENGLARLLAQDLHAELRYAWNVERRNFFRRTLLAGRCDVVMSVPVGLRVVATTRPYFTSSYVFVTRSDGGLNPSSFDDPALRGARIGLQLLGADGANPPPAMALSARGITANITGFPMWGAEDDPNPQGHIIEAVAAKKIDVAVVWGPFAGYFAKPLGGSLRLTPVTSDPQTSSLAFTYGMAVGVRKADTALRDRLQLALDRHRDEIDALLRTYGIPLLPTPAAP